MEYQDPNNSPPGLAITPIPARKVFLRVRIMIAALVIFLPLLYIGYFVYVAGGDKSYLLISFIPFAFFEIGVFLINLISYKTGNDAGRLSFVVANLLISLGFLFFPVMFFYPLSYMMPWEQGYL